MSRYSSLQVMVFKGSTELLLHELMRADVSWLIFGKVSKTNAKNLSGRPNLVIGEC
jgi:hypothetical protein